MIRERFQVGDLVERLGYNSGGVTVGRTYEVLAVVDEGEGIVHLDDRGKNTHRTAEYYVLVKRSAAVPIGATVNFKGWATWA